MQIICQTSVYLIISMFFLYKINHQMWFSHPPVVLQPVSYVHRTKPATVLPGCQGDSWAGLQVVESPRQRHWKSPLRSPLLLHCQSHHYPWDILWGHNHISTPSHAPHSLWLTAEGESIWQALAGACSKCWGCYWDGVLAAGLNALFPAWRFAGWSDTQDSVSSSSKGPERCKSSKDVTCVPPRGKKDHIVPSLCSHEW